MVGLHPLVHRRGREHPPPKKETSRLSGEKVTVFFALPFFSRGERGRKEGCLLSSLLIIRTSSMEDFPLTHLLKEKGR